MKSRKLSKIARAIYEKRTAVVYFALAFVFSGLLRSGDQFTTLLVAYTATFWVYTYAELRRKYHRPRNPETKATLKVSTESFVDWAVTNMEGELVVSGWGNRIVELPSTEIRIERDTKVKYSEYTYVVEEEFIIAECRMWGRRNRDKILQRLANIFTCGLMFRGKAWRARDDAEFNVSSNTPCY